MHRHHSVRRIRGLTLVETLLAIVAGIIIVAIAFVVAEQVFGANRLAQAETDLVSLQSSINEAFSGQPNYSGLSSTAVDVQLNIFPASMVSNSTTVTDPWGGTVTLAGASNGVVPSGFSITFNGVPNSACTKLAEFQEGQWYELKVNGTEIYGPTKATTPEVATIAGACNPSGSGTGTKGNSLVWYSAS